MVFHCFFFSVYPNISFLSFSPSLTRGWRQIPHLRLSLEWGFDCLVEATDGNGGSHLWSASVQNHLSLFHLFSSSHFSLSFSLEETSTVFSRLPLGTEVLIYICPKPPFTCTFFLLVFFTFTGGDFNFLVEAPDGNWGSHIHLSKTTFHFHYLDTQVSLAPLNKFLSGSDTSTR